MPLAPVVVEIAPSDVSAEHRQILLDACTRAAGSAECVSGNSAVDTQEAAAIAIVSFRTPGGVRIEVALRPENRWIVREIEFDASSPLTERFRTAGFVVGTLSSGAFEAPEPKEETPAEPPPAAPPRSPPSPPAAVQAERSTAPEPPAEPDGPAFFDEARAKRRAEPGFVLGGGAFVGTALSPGPVRAGGELVARIYAFELPLFLGLSAAYSRGVDSVHGIDTEWISGYFGLGYELDVARFYSLTFLGEGFVQRFAAARSPTTSPAPNSGARTLLGARAGVENVFWVTRAVGAYAGAAGEWASGTTDLVVGQRAVSTERAIRFTARGGLFYAFR